MLFVTDFLINYFFTWAWWCFLLNLLLQFLVFPLALRKTKKSTIGHIHRRVSSFTSLQWYPSKLWRACTRLPALTKCCPHFSRVLIGSLDCRVLLWLAKGLLLFITVCSYLGGLHCTAVWCRTWRSLGSIKPGQQESYQPDIRRADCARQPLSKAEDI